MALVDPRYDWGGWSVGRLLNALDDLGITVDEIEGVDEITVTIQASEADRLTDLLKGLSRQ